MAHRCPECYSTCHCGGDIDDLIFDSDQYCSHCDNEEGFEKEVYCSNCGWLNDESEHEESCGSKPILFD